MRNRTIKNLAICAKNRLIQKSGKLVSPASSNITFKIFVDEDKDFYEKVKNLLEENSISPIKELMDSKKYEELDEFGRQKYLLDTIEKFQLSKRRIESDARLSL
jgi:DNA replication initiation complex subunit (GINS family)